MLVVANANAVFTLVGQASPIVEIVAQTGFAESCPIATAGPKRFQTLLGQALGAWDLILVRTLAVVVGGYNTDQAKGNQGRNKSVIASGAAMGLGRRGRNRGQGDAGGKRQDDRRAKDHAG